MTVNEACLAIRNQPLERAKTLVEHEGFTFRLLSVDGRGGGAFDDFQPARINVRVVAGIVVDAVVDAELG